MNRTISLCVYVSTLYARIKRFSFKMDWIRIQILAIQVEPMLFSFIEIMKKNIPRSIPGEKFEFRRFEQAFV